MISSLSDSSSNYCLSVKNKWQGENFSLCLMLLYLNFCADDIMVGIINAIRVLVHDEMDIFVFFKIREYIVDLREVLSFSSIMEAAAESL